MNKSNARFRGIRGRLKSSIGVLAFLAFAAVGSGAIEKADLSADLAYLRVHSFAASAVTISAELSAPRALVLDFRYATASAGDAERLREALAKRTGANPTFVLVSPSTPNSIAGALSPLPSGVITLGTANSTPKAAVEIAQAPDADRRAFDAADSGLQLAQLINGRIEKERFDEAALVREFRNESPAVSPKAPPKEEKDQAPVLIDRVLQRAVHLYRATHAIKPRG